MFSSHMTRQLAVGLILLGSVGLLASEKKKHRAPQLDLPRHLPGPRRQAIWRCEHGWVRGTAVEQGPRIVAQLRMGLRRTDVSTDPYRRCCDHEWWYYR